MTDALTRDALDQIRARLCIGFLIPDSMAVAVSVMKQMEADIRLLLAEVDRLRSELDREDASHTRTIIERDEAQDAMQRLDVLTGGDGEYRASTIDPEAPATPALMANGIAERYATLEADRDAAVARAEKAEAMLKTIICENGALVFLDGRNEHGSHVLFDSVTNLPGEAVGDLQEGDEAELIISEAEAAGFKEWDCVWIKAAYQKPQIGNYGGVELAGYWYCDGIDADISRFCMQFAKAPEEIGQ